MSKWVHVCGLIYVDHFNTSGNLKERDNFGKVLEATFNIQSPTGSEGGLIIKAVRGDHAGSSNIGRGGRFITTSYRWAISIFGDLRDYENKQAVVDWINSSIKKIKGGIVREGIVQVIGEENDNQIWQYKEEN